MTYRFEIGGGMTVEGRKSNWPHCLHIFMDRQDAFELLSQLATQLSHEDRKRIGIDYCGKMETEEDEDNP